MNVLMAFLLLLARLLECDCLSNIKELGMIPIDHMCFLSMCLRVCFFKKGARAGVYQVYFPVHVTTLTVLNYSM